MKELKFSDELASPKDGRLDGPCNLPSNIDWPCDPDGNPLLHLMSIPLEWLVELIPTDSGSCSWISIFVSFDPTGFSHYAKMSTNAIDHNEAAVILHDMSGPSVCGNSFQSSRSKAISIANARDGDENVASHIGFEPAWVQDPLQISGFSWKMSVYGPDMDEFLGPCSGIFSDGVGYLFLKNDLNPKEFGIAGKFFLQI